MGWATCQLFFLLWERHFTPLWRSRHFYICALSTSSSSREGGKRKKDIGSIFLFKYSFHAGDFMTSRLLEAHKVLSKSLNLGLCEKNLRRTRDGCFLCYTYIYFLPKNMYQIRWNNYITMELRAISVRQVESRYIRNPPSSWRIPFQINFE